MRSQILIALLSGVSIAMAQNPQPIVTLTPVPPNQRTAEDPGVRKAGNMPVRHEAKTNSTYAFTEREGAITIRYTDSSGVERSVTTQRATRTLPLIESAWKRLPTSEYVYDYRVSNGENAQQGIQLIVLGFQFLGHAGTKFESGGDWIGARTGWVYGRGGFRGTHTGDPLRAHSTLMPGILAARVRGDVPAIQIGTKEEALAYRSEYEAYQRGKGPLPHVRGEMSSHTVASLHGPGGPLSFENDSLPVPVIGPVIDPASGLDGIRKHLENVAGYSGFEFLAREINDLATLDPGSLKARLLNLKKETPNGIAQQFLDAMIHNLENLNQ